MWSDQESRFWGDYLESHYGIRGALSRLDGEFDLNIAVSGDDGLQAVLKIMRLNCDPALVDMQIAALDHLADHTHDLPVPHVIKRFDGAASAAVDIFLDRETHDRQACQFANTVGNHPFAGACYILPIGASVQCRANHGGIHADDRPSVDVWQEIPYAHGLTHS